MATNWLSLDKASGSGNGTLKVTATGNYTGRNDRNGVVTVKAASISRTVHVAQKGKATYVVKQGDAQADRNGGDVSLTFNTNASSFRLQASQGGIKAVMANGKAVTASGGVYTPAGDPGASMQYSVVVTITVPANTTEQGRAITVTCSSGSIQATASINQASGSKTYGEIIISTFTYPQIGAEGGAVSPTVAYKQTWGWNGSTTGGGEISSGLSVKYAQKSGNGLNTADGKVTAATKGTTESGETTVGTVTLTVSGNGKTATRDCVVKQEANAIESYNYGAWSVTCTVNPSQIAVGGGTSTVTAKASRTMTPVYTSGATGTAGSKVGTVALSISDTTNFSLSGTTVTAKANGTPNDRTCTVTAKCNEDTGKTATATITQAGASTLTVSPESLAFEASGGTKDITITSNDSWTATIS